MSEFKGKNKRYFERMKTACLVLYASVRHGDAGEFHLTNARDISASGLLMNTPEPIEVDSTLKVYINLPVEEEPLETFAHVVRCKKMSKAGPYRIALHFC